MMLSKTKIRKFSKQYLSERRNTALPNTFNLEQPVSPKASIRSCIRPTHPLRQGEKRKNGSLLTYCKAKRHPQPPKGGFHIRRKASPNPGNLSRCNREGGFTTRLRGCEAFRQKGRTPFRQKGHTPFRQKGRTPLGKRSVPL